MDKILKKCPCLIPPLFNLYNVCWLSATIPQTLKRGVVRLIPKSSASTCPSYPANFRPIALTLCVGKVFISILKNTYLPLMLQNSYMDTAIQKVFVIGIPGCAEHHCKSSKMLQRNTDLSVCVGLIWLMPMAVFHMA